jgi:hypothetical protein
MCPTAEVRCKAGGGGERGGCALFAHGCRVEAARREADAPPPVTGSPHPASEATGTGVGGRDEMRRGHRRPAGGGERWPVAGRGPVAGRAPGGGRRVTGWGGAAPAGGREGGREGMRRPRVGRSQ